MSGPRLLEVLPELVKEGLIDGDQAERIRLRYSTPGEHSSGRLTLLFSILGGLLIGLGIILVVAHNWDSFGRVVRTIFAFLPMGIGQALVLYVLLRKREQRAWKEGTSIFLMLAVGACMALVSQIYHIPGELDGFLLAWCLLTVPLVYVPGALTAFLGYLVMITWYAITVRMEHWRDHMLPWQYLPLLALALPFYIRQWRQRGATVGTFWAGLLLAGSIAIAGQLFWRRDHLEIAVAIAGLACAYCLVPWFHKGRMVRTGAFPFLGGAAMLGVLLFLSYHDAWRELWRPERHIGIDVWAISLMVVIGSVTYALALRHRRPGEGTWLPETLGVVLLAYGLGNISIPLATLVVNGWLLALGLHAVINGLRNDSLPRMNLGLAILSLTIVLRFFDLDINDALKGAVFMAMGAGFLVMNVRMLNQRKRTGNG